MAAEAYEIHSVPQNELVSGLDERAQRAIDAIRNRVHSGVPETSARVDSMGYMQQYKGQTPPGYITSEVF